MSDYTPNKWVIIKLQQEPEDIPQFRVFAGWAGGYTSGDSWKFSSGIEKTIEYDDHYEIHNASGSIYRCSKNAIGMTGYMMAVFSGYKKEADDKGFIFEIIDEVPFIVKED